MCMIEDGEPATLYHSKVVNHSRKARFCEECRRPIEVGDRYKSAWMLYEDYWSSFDTCEHCIAAQRWLESQCGGFLHGGVLVDLEEHLTELDFGPGEKTALLRLIVGIKRGWRAFGDSSRFMAVPV